MSHSHDHSYVVPPNERSEEELRRKRAQLRSEMAAMKGQLKEIDAQLKELAPAAHVHGADCGASCLEIKSLPPEEETKFGEPVPLEAEAAAVDPEPSKERAPGEPVWTPKLVKRRRKTSVRHRLNFPDELRKYCDDCIREFTPPEYDMVVSKAVKDTALGRKVGKAFGEAYAAAMAEAGTPLPEKMAKVKPAKEPHVHKPNEYDVRCPKCNRLVRLDVMAVITNEESRELLATCRNALGTRNDFYKFAMWHIGLAQAQAHKLYLGVRIYNTGAETAEGRVKFLTPMIRLPAGSYGVPDFPGMERVEQHAEKFEEYLKSDLYTGTQRSIPEYELKLISGPAPPPPQPGTAPPGPQIRSL